jgi:hypothetical protein
MAEDIPDIYADGARLLVNPAGFTLTMTRSVPAEGEEQQPVAVVNVARLRFSHALAARLGELLSSAAVAEVPSDAMKVVETSTIDQEPAEALQEPVAPPERESAPTAR